MKFLFKTSATMKEHNRKNWWVNSDIVGELIIDANDIEDALKEYQKRVEHIDISNNAIKNKSPMYIDTKDGETKQIGYVITASMEFDKTNEYGYHVGWSKQYFDLWVEIKQLLDIDFKECE